MQEIETKLGYPGQKFYFFRLCLISISLVLITTACENQDVQTKKGQAIDTAWKTLKPYTSSGNFSNWEVNKSKLVSGGETGSLFEGDPAPGCWKGPASTNDKPVSASESYWLIQMNPKPATPKAQDRTPSPTEPPFIPEPFVREASFLIDTTTGEVLRRKLYCVIY